MHRPIDRIENLHAKLESDFEKNLIFGPFTLYTKQHLLTIDGRTINLGSRALELLICLARRAGGTVCKAELIAAAWPRTVVEECNLRAQIVALRKVLKTYDPFELYIETVPGEGYRFTADVRALMPPPAALTHELLPQSLPLRAATILGREAVIERLSTQLLRSRLITLSGPGGIGKTTVALEVARQCEHAFADGVWFFDLAHQQQLDSVLNQLSHALGLEIERASSLQELPGQFGTCRRLLLVDGCEQAIGAVAGLAETLLKWAPYCALLVTSREVLNAEGEWVERLRPLPVVATVDAHSPARDLFIQTLQARDASMMFGPAELDCLRGICNKLDGVPLDIELAAHAACTLPIKMVEQLLDTEFRLQICNPNKCHRHRSLSASLDWSFDALSVHESAVLCRVAVFKGAFTLSAVLAMVENDEELSTEEALTALDRLIDKSLLFADHSVSARNYRMLETTRLYALEKLKKSGQFQLIAARLAAYAMSVLQAFAKHLEATDEEAWRSLYGAEGETVKSALSWAISDGGNELLGLDLTLTALGLAGPDDDLG